MQQAFCHGSRSVRCSALKDNVAKLPPIAGISCIKIPALDKTIPAIQGKMASVSIYNHLQQKYGKLNKQAALEGLSLYDEVVEDAIQRPGRCGQHSSGPAALPLTVTAMTYIG
jgi:hypothetical protein